MLVYTATYSLGDLVLDYVQEQTEIGKQFPTPETIRERVKLSAQEFLGSFGWTSVTYDWYNFLYPALSSIHPIRGSFR